jgi:hypothetical protein
MLKKDLPIYVMNRSNPRGDVTVTVFRPDGAPYLITVPRTWIPICVTDQVSRPTIQSSDDFRRNIQNGMLELLSVEEAKDKLKDPDAVEEIGRLNMSKYSSYDSDLKEADTIRDFSNSLETADDVSLTVKEILQRDISATDMYHLLRADEDLLKENDFKYITLHGKGKVKDWAQTKLES